MACSGSSNAAQKTLVLTLFLSTLSLVAAFTSSRLPSVYQPKHQCVNSKLRKIRLDNNKKENDNEATDPDNKRRRQILFTMLSSVTSSTLVKQQAAQADQTYIGSACADSNIRSKPCFNIIKPPLDDRDYVSFVLDNGLRVLLCSDPSTNEAAVAMDVHVGACSDPVDVPGLAHFTEHMLFLGTKPYPNEDSFESFLATNGGSSNAFTDSENTVYYFDMEVDSDKRLTEGLLRFGSFFSSPLFTETATNRELNAIESENAKNLQSDTFRTYQIAKERVNADHPFSKFFTGNRKTLLDGTKARGIDLRQELIKFYERYYSANQMALAIIAPQPIKDLQSIVRKAFGDIPNRKVGRPEEGWSSIPPYSTNSVIPSLGHKVEIVPVQDLRQVMVTWPVIYKQDSDRVDSLLCKPTAYVAHLIGHEGPRSLLSYLKEKGWATSLGASNEEELSDFETLQVVVGLTTEGLKYVDDVVESIYSYIDLMRGGNIPNYIYEEVLQIEELQWRFAIKGSPRNAIVSVVSAMQKYPPELYLAGPRRLALNGFNNGYSILNSTPRTGYASKQQLDEVRASVESYIDCLNVDNSFVTVMSKTFDGKTDQTEVWYGTKYRASPIDAATQSKWKNCVPAERLKVDFPKPNVFIPSEAGLKVKNKVQQVDAYSRRTFESRMVPIKAPELIRDDGEAGKWKMYFKEDDRFGLPKAYVIFEIFTPRLYSSPKMAALASMFELVVSDKLNEYAYDASLAGLIYDIKVVSRGIRLTFGGYNDKLIDFTTYVVNKLSKKVSELLPRTDQEFEKYKDQIVRVLSAFDVKQPYAHASYYAQLTLQPRRFQYTNDELRDATQKITLSDLKEYSSTVWKSGRGEALIQGNLDKFEALQILDRVDSVINFKTIPSSELPPRLVALPLPTTPATKTPPRLVVAEPNPSNANSVSYVLLQDIGTTEYDHVMIELLGAIIQEPFYNQLRTKQQLGYVVSSGVRAVGESRTLAFIVQSSVAPASSLTKEIIKYLDTVKGGLLQKLPKADLAVYVKSLIDRKTEPDKDLSIEVTRNWSEISSGRLQFDRIQKEASALLTVQKDSVMSYWDKLYADNGRRILITEIVPEAAGPASEKKPQRSTEYATEGLMYKDDLILGIDDIEKFRIDRE